MNWDDFEIALALWLVSRSFDAGCYCNLFGCEHTRTRHAVLCEITRRIIARELANVIR